jgi:hypothetical protein
VPLHTPISSRRAGLPRAAIILAATGIAAGGVTFAVGDSPSAALDHSIAEPKEPAVSRYNDIEANKANSMRALGGHLAEERGHRNSRYNDLEANKAHSQHAR